MANMKTGKTNETRISKTRNKLLIKIKNEYPELLEEGEGSAEFKKNVVNYYTIKFSENSYKVNRNTFYFVAIAGIIALLTFLSQQAQILPTLNSNCTPENFNFYTNSTTHTESGGSQNYYFSFINIGQAEGSLSVYVQGNSISTSLYPVPNNFSIALANGQTANYILELTDDQLNPPSTYNFSIVVQTYDLVAGLIRWNTGSYVFSCSYKTIYNASNPSYDNIYDKNVFDVYTGKYWTSS